jgi:hypothetical protein
MSWLTWLKYALPVLTTASALLLSAHDWSDKRTARAKRLRRWWVILTVLGIPITVAVQAGDDLQRDQDRSEQVGQLRQIIVEERRAHSQAAELNRNLKPLSDFIRSYFPGLPPAEAVESLKKELAAQRSEIQKQQEQLAQEKDRTAALEQRAGPRHLTPTARRNMVMILSEMKGTRADFGVALKSKEASDFAEELKNCFRDSGWDVRDQDTSRMLLFGIFTGIELGAPSTPAGQPYPEYVGAAFRALQLAGVSVRIVNDETIRNGQVVIHLGSKD